MKNLEFSALQRSLVMLAICALVAHFICLRFPGLLDPSESRYATIGQRMVQTGHWLVPEIDRGDGFEPFWGKPPAHFWAVAAALTTFGFNEWAARLPSFLASLATLFLIVQFCTSRFNRATGLVAGAILASSATFFVIAGSCMVDMSLTMAVTGALTCFALATEGQRSRAAGYGFYAFLALGMLIKGPLALLLVGGSLFLWCLIGGNWLYLLRLPWVGGSALFFLISVPWFVLAEGQSPGLVRYFFVNENFLRFVSPSYGDRYGSAHPVFRGAIWPMFLAGLFPWSLLLCGIRASGATLTSAFNSLRSENARWDLFCVCSFLTPLLFFTPARSVIFTYVLPSLPAASVLCARSITNGWLHDRARRVLQVLCFGLLLCLTLSPVALLFAAKSFWAPGLLLCLIVGIAGIIFYRRVHAAPSITAVALLLAALFPASVLSGLLYSLPLLDGHLSTKSLMWALDQRFPQTLTTFLGKLPYSAQFYSRAITPESRPLKRAESDLQDFPDSGLLVLTRKQRKILGLQGLTTADPLQIGAWSVFPPPFFPQGRKDSSVIVGP